MARVVRVGVYLAGILLAFCLLLLVIGLAIGAWPDSFASLGIEDAGKRGFVLALCAGIGAIASSVLIRILHLLATTVDEEVGPEPG